jgi:hypothetical protein
VFAAELYVICAPRRTTKGKGKEFVGAAEKAVDVAMNPMFTNAALMRRRSAGVDGMSALVAGGDSKPLAVECVSRGLESCARTTTVLWT